MVYGRGLRKHCRVPRSTRPPEAPPPPAEQLVSSSDLVRHFGLWQERATRAPLYILHRGRPRFVMTSIETMEALCAPHALVGAGEPTRSAIDATALLDATSDLILFADAAGAITASSRAARAHFGSVAEIGAPLDAIAPLPTRPFLVDTIRRVIASGISDHLELVSSRRDGRTLAVAIEPAGAGVALFAQDGTTQRDHARALAGEQALAEAMHAAGQVAAARINPRGYVVAPTPALAALTGLPRETLASLRFTALAEIGARAALGAAVEAAMAGGGPAAVDARLLVNRADPVAVRIGLAAVRGAASGGVEGVAAILVAA